MPSIEETTIRIKRKAIVGLIVFPLFSSFALFMNLLDNPRFQQIRNLDVVRLIAIGACWGVACVGLVMLLRSKFGKAS